MTPVSKAAYRETIKNIVIGALSLRVLVILFKTVKKVYTLWSYKNIHSLLILLCNVIIILRAVKVFVYKCPTIFDSEI